jgi:hypothetical protein
MKAGDTFYLSKKAADGHLWVIISDPERFPDPVLFASLTSFDVTKEDACVIEGGEHPNLTHKTCVAYDKIRAASLEQLEKLARAKLLHQQQPVSAELLARIRLGASISRWIEWDHVVILVDQGLLD